MRTDYIVNATSGYAYEITTRLVVEECCECGVLFAMPEDMRGRALADHSLYFYCPNGHDQHFTGPTAAEQQRTRAERAEARVTHLSDQLDAERRSKAAIKGHLTRARKRGGAGLCPVEGCRRHFRQLDAHIRSQHPGFLASLEDT